MKSLRFPCYSKQYLTLSLSLSLIWIQFQKKSNKTEKWQQLFKSSVPFGILFVWFVCFSSCFLFSSKIKKNFLFFLRCRNTKRNIDWNQNNVCCCVIVWFIVHITQHTLYTSQFDSDAISNGWIETYSIIVVVVVVDLSTNPFLHTYICSIYRLKIPKVACLFCTEKRDLLTHREKHAMNWL